MQALDACLRRAELLPDETLLLACSGGRDSQVLMHAAARLAGPWQFVVAHVHHGLQTPADDWQAFCADQAAALGLRFLTRRLHAAVARQGSPAGLEAWAREWRYRALADMASAAGAQVVITAHHANDQLETVEIRRRRGSGVLGLAGMRERAPLPHAPAGMLLLRPFLGMPRSQLDAWGRGLGITWIEDPANADPRFTRNRVRQFVSQRVRADPLALPDELAAIGLVQQAADRIRAQAAADVQAASLHMQRPESPARTVHPAHQARPAVPALSRAALLRLEPARRAEALRHWLGMLGCRMPTRSKLAELERQLVLAASAEARICHDGCWLLRYRDRIGLMPQPAPVQPLVLRWQGESQISLPGGILVFELLDGVTGAGMENDRLKSGLFSTRSFCAVADAAAELAAHAAPAPHVPVLMLDQGRGGERLRLVPRAPSRSLKNLMQEHGVPACLRASLPVLRRDGGVIFAAPFDSVVPAAWLSGKGESAGLVRLRWHARPDIAAWLQGYAEQVLVAPASPDRWHPCVGMCHQWHHD